MIYLMVVKQNSRLYWRMCGLSTGGKSEFSHFIACTEVNSYLCIKYFLKKDGDFMVFRFKLAYILMHNELSGNRNENDNL